MAELGTMDQYQYSFNPIPKEIWELKFIAEHNILSMLPKLNTHAQVVSDDYRLELLIKRHTLSYLIN